MAIADAKKADALRVLDMCGIPLGVDFHMLRCDQVERLVEQADIRRYRKPKNANGSRGRYFHDLMQRRARR